MREEPSSPTDRPSETRKGGARGTTLDRYLRAKGALAPAVAARIGCDLVRALARDLSPRATGRPFPIQPSRVLIAANGSVRILPGAEASGRPLAARYPLYASPEEALGGKGDYRSQFYSLGCMLFEIVTGRPPFRGDGTKATLRAHLRDAIPDPRSDVPEVPEKLAQVVKELLFKDPEFRLRDARELLARLRNAANGESRDEARALPQASRTPASVRRRHSAAAAEAAPNRETGARSPGAPPASTPASGAPASERRSPQKTAAGRARAPGSGTTRRMAPGDISELAAPPAKPRRPGWVFTIAGGALGVIASVLVGILVAAEEENERKKVEAKKRETEVSALEERKEAFRATVRKEAERVANALKKAKEVAADSTMDLSRKRDAIIGITNSVCHLPGSVEVAAVFDSLPEEEIEESPETEKAYEKIVESIESLRSEGRLGDALGKIREAERAHPEHESELDPLIEEISEELETLWQADEEAIRTRLSEREFAEAQALVEKALRYGDNRIRLEATAYQKQIERRETTATGESEGPPPTDGADDDFQNLLEEFEKGEG